MTRHKGNWFARRMLRSICIGEAEADLNTECTITECIFTNLTKYMIVSIVTLTIGGVLSSWNSAFTGVRQEWYLIGVASLIFILDDILGRFSHSPIDVSARTISRVFVTTCNREGKSNEIPYLNWGTLLPNSRSKQEIEGISILQLISLVSTLAYFTVLILNAGILGPQEFGNLALGLLIATTVSTISQLGTAPAIAKRLSERRGKQERFSLAVTAFLIVVPLSLLGGIGVSVLSNWIAIHVFHGPSLAPALFVFGLLIPVMSVSETMFGMLRGLGRFSEHVLLRSGLSVAKLVLLIIATLSESGAKGIAWAILIAHGIIVIPLAYRVLVSVGYLSFPDIKTPARQILAFSRYSFVTSVKPFPVLLVFFVGAFHSVKGVGIIYLILLLDKAVRVITHASGSTIFDDISTGQITGENAGRVYSSVTKWMMIILIPLIFFIGSRPALIILKPLNSGYAIGSFALSLIVASVLMEGISNTAKTTILALDRPQLFLRIRVILGAIGIVGGFVLVSKYSLIGVVTAVFLVRCLASLSYLQILTKLDLNLAPKSSFKAISIGLSVWILFYITVTWQRSLTILLYIMAWILFFGSYVNIIAEVNGFESDREWVADRISLKSVVETIRSIQEGTLAYEFSEALDYYEEELVIKGGLLSRIVSKVN